MTKRIAYRTCPLCEATCGLELHLEDDEVTLVRGDRDDVFSHGFLCPKGTALKQLDADPDRLRTPLVRARRHLARRDVGRGVRRDRARPRADHRGARPRRGRRLPRQPERAQPRRDSSTAGCCCRRSARTNVFSASTVDQMPKQVSARA